MLPHCVTSARLLLAGAFCALVALVADQTPLSLAAMVALLVLAALEEASDLLDGILARRLGQTSELGGIFDPLADSLARLAIYFALALAGWLPIAVPLVMAARDIIVAYTRIVAALSGGATSARLSGKVKAIVQGAAIPAVLVLAGMGDGPGVQAWRWAVGAGVVVVTLWSLVDYLRGVAPAIRRMARPHRRHAGR